MAEKDLLLYVDGKWLNPLNISYIEMSEGYREFQSSRRDDWKIKKMKEAGYPDFVIEWFGFGPGDYYFESQWIPAKVVVYGTGGEVLHKSSFQSNLQAEKAKERIERALNKLLNEFRTT